MNFESVIDAVSHHIIIVQLSQPWDLKLEYPSIFKTLFKDPISLKNSPITSSRQQNYLQFSICRKLSTQQYTTQTSDRRDTSLR